LLSLLQGIARWLLTPVDRLLGSGFRPGPKNPMRHLGALTIFFFWIVLVSGIWLFIFFRTSVEGAYQSIEYLTVDQWYIGGVMRSLHRYASDAAIVTFALHIVREFAFDRHRSARWFSWLTGVPLVWLVIPLGVTGYWLVWDRLAVYVAITSAELLDWLPIFTDSMARNFLSDDVLSDRFFTLMAFLHLVGLPLFLVFGIWLHVFRINRPNINPPRTLMAGALLAMLVLSLAYPAVSQGQADLTRIPDSLGLDWFYLTVYPLMKSWPPGRVWGLLVGISLLLSLAPWLPPARARAVAKVDLDNCNGCERCVADCPFGAVNMAARSDGKPYPQEAVVDPALCLSCGLCVGACPTSMPFRTRGELVPGIDLPDQTMADLRTTLQDAAKQLDGEQRVMLFFCEGTRGLEGLADHRTALIALTCVGQLPPSYVDFVLSRKLADAVLLCGCDSGGCQYRLGEAWTSQRMRRERDPRLRTRVDSTRLAMGWESPWSECHGPRDLLDRFRAALAAPVPTAGARTRKPRRVAMQVVAWGLFAVVVGALSVWPQFRLLDPGQALVSLSFSHAGQRVGECRRLSQAELDRLPPNMRNPSECPRERHPVRVEFSVDGSLVWRQEVPPSGIWNDGESTVYQRLPVAAGMHVLAVGMSDSGRATGFDFTVERSMSLEGGQHVVVEFDPVQQKFVFR